METPDDPRGYLTDDERRWLEARDADEAARIAREMADLDVSPELRETWDVKPSGLPPDMRALFEPVPVNELEYERQLKRLRDWMDDYGTEGEA
jgi:hypothetical protein